MLQVNLLTIRTLSAFHILTWLNNYWFWLLIGLFLCLLLFIGYLNYRLPRRHDIIPSHFLPQTLGDNGRLRQLLAQFSHEQEASAQQTVELNKNSNNLVTSDKTVGSSTAPITNPFVISGIYPIDDGREALTIRTMLVKLAERSLDLQYYMWHDDASGRLLFYEVWQAATRGVRVRLLLDDNNTADMDAVLQTLDQHPNIEVRLFNPFMNRRFRLIGYLTTFKRLNRRMHNKSFTVDNQISIFGGRNIGDEYFDIGHGTAFADMDVAAIGPVVDAISTDFDRYWNCRFSYPLNKIVRKNYAAVNLAMLADDKYQKQTTHYREALTASQFLPNLEQGKLSFEWVPVQFVSDNPEKAFRRRHTNNKLIDQLAHVLLATRNRLTIVSPYFVPTRIWTERFVQLAKRGVNLNILTNSLNTNDVLAVHAGYMRYRIPLLQAKINLYELKANPHAKKPLLNALLDSEDAPIANKLIATQLKHLQTGLQRQPSRQRQAKKRLVRKTTSLHAKVFSVDGQKIFVGSFNFDPRSAALNTEMGAIIASPALACQLDDTIEQWTKELSYVVTIHNKALNWHDNSLDPAKVFTDEPESSWSQRLLVWIIRWLPIEDFL